MKTLLVLHGNFESSAHWQFLIEAARERDCRVEVFGLWSFLQSPLSSWASFIAEFRKVQSNKSWDAVLGYSLGGRVLLNLLASGWQVPRAIFLSTHPGLLGSEAREERLWQDLQWKQKVLTLDWAEVRAEWNAQPVLAGPGSSAAHTDELFAGLETDRREIALAFDVLSLARMPDFSASAHKFSAQIEWLVGAEDRKFVKLGQDFCLPRQIPVIEIAGAGHRLHRDQPAALIRQLFLT